MTEVVAGYDTCPSWAPALGYLGVASCMVLSVWGSAWGTWRAGLGICEMGIDHPKGIMKNIIPIVMAGVLGIYGLIVSVIITQSISQPRLGANTYSEFNAYNHLFAGLICGLSCLGAGGAIGVLGDTGVRGFGLRAERGRKWWYQDSSEVTGEDSAPLLGGSEGDAADAANKLYVGLLIMLIFSEAIALYGLIVALIMTQKVYTCG